MLEFEEYKVKLNNLKPELEELYTSLGLEQAKREVEELEIKSSQPGFWDNPEESQKIVSRMGSLKGKVEAYNKMTELCDDLLTICEMAIEENDESMLEELESGYQELEDGIAEQKLRTLLTGEYDSHNALVSQCCTACTPAGQSVTALPTRSWTIRMAIPRVSSPPIFSLRAKMPTASSRVKTAYTVWSVSLRLMHPAAVRPRSRR